MTEPGTNPQRVIVIERDVRVRAALTAIINATPGLQVVAAIASIANADNELRTYDAAVAVVDVRAAGADQDVSVIQKLSAHLPVVAISATACDEARAMEAGATACCDKDGNADGVTAAVAAAAHRHAPARESSQEWEPGQP